MTRDERRQYAAAIDLWERRFDTLDIAVQLALSEAVVARWIANWRDLAGGFQPSGASA